MNQTPTYRRTRGYLSPFTTNHLHLRNPYIVAFFAFSYPGFGNLILHRYAKAFILILWEVFINHQARVNLGIMYSLQGHFEKAKQVLDERWLLLYVGIYMYAIWDAYRSTVDINKLYLLADREDAPLNTIKMGTFDMNYMDKRKPWVALAWSVGYCPRAWPYVRTQGDHRVVHLCIHNRDHVLLPFAAGHKVQLVRRI